MLSSIIKSLFFPSLVPASFLSGAFFLISVLDGYGDTRLFLAYFILFFPLFLICNFILIIYGKIKKITATIFNQFFLLGSTFLGFIILFVTNYLIKYIFGSISQPAFYHFPRNLSFVLAIISLLWLSSFRKRKYKYAVMIVSLCSFGMWMALSVVGGISPKKAHDISTNGPNILLLTVESLRYDYLGCNGNKDVKTPFIDELAIKGIPFDNYYVQAPYTTASIATMMTGLYPFNHGSRVFGEKPHSQYEPFISKLAAQDYLINVDGSYYPELFPKSSKYEYQKYSLLAKIMSRIAGSVHIINDQAGNIMPSIFGSYCFGNTTSMRQTSNLLRNIRINKNQKWFFWTHFIKNCHWPYNAPPQFAKIYIKDNPSQSLDISIESIEAFNENQDQITEEVLKQIRLAYSAEVTCIDRQIGFIVRQLEKFDLMEKTVIILTSDHGELLGENKHIGHGNFLNDALIHVPLIMYAQDSKYFEGGIRIGEFVEEVDIAPTILDLCGINNEGSLDGKSIKKLLDSKDWCKSSIYSEVVDDNGGFLACFREEEHKLVWDSAMNIIQLFNIVNDPREMTDISGDNPDELTSIKARFLEFLRRSSLDELKPDLKPKIDKRMRDKMKTLGYIK